MSSYQPPCLGHSQCSLEPRWWAGELNALSQVVLHCSAEREKKNAFILQMREKESTVKIFEQSIQTPCGLYWRQAAREQLLRMGDEEMAKTRRQFSGFFVMGCQNGFDLLRDLLIINCIICFLLGSSQEKANPNSSSEAWAQFIPSERVIGPKLAVQAVGRWWLKVHNFPLSPKENTDSWDQNFAKVWRKQLIFYLWVYYSGYCLPN